MRSENLDRMSALAWVLIFVGVVGLFGFVVVPSFSDVSAPPGGAVTAGFDSPARYPIGVAPDRGGEDVTARVKGPPTLAAVVRNGADGRRHLFPPNIASTGGPMKGLNRATLIGNLGIDPDLTHLPDGTPKVRFTVATNKRWKDRETGKDQESTEWHNIVGWKGLAELAAKHLRKGAPVYVEGEIRTRTFEDKEQITRWITEIHAREIYFLGGANRQPEAPTEETAPDGY